MRLTLQARRLEAQPQGRLRLQPAAALASSYCLPVPPAPAEPFAALTLHHDVPVKHLNMRALQLHIRLTLCSSLLSRDPRDPAKHIYGKEKQLGEDKEITEKAGALIQGYNESDLCKCREKLESLALRVAKRQDTCTASMSASTTCSICARMCARAISKCVRSLQTAGAY